MESREIRTCLRRLWLENIDYQTERTALINRVTVQRGSSCISILHISFVYQFLHFAFSLSQPSCGHERNRRESPEPSPEPVEPEPDCDCSCGVRTASSR